MINGCNRFEIELKSILFNLFNPINLLSNPTNHPQSHQSR